MAVRRKKMLLFILLAALGVGLPLFPLALIVIQDIYGSFINEPFSICEVMDNARLKEALQQGFDVNAGCCAEHMIGECSIARPNSTPIVFAVENQNIEAVRLLLENGSDVNQSSLSGYALTAAASSGQQELVQILLRNKANHESKNIAVRLAAHSGNIEIVKLILRDEEPTFITSSCAELACSLVTEFDQIDNPHILKQRELFMHLINTCLDPNISCGPDRLLSSIGRKDEHAPMMKALLEHGADLNAKEKNGKSVREYLMSFWDYNSRPQIKALIEQDEVPH